MSQKNFMSYGDAETLFTEVGQELSDKVPKSQLTANNTDFRFGYDENTGKYGYIINEGGADTVIPFKDCDSSEITVSETNQILSGYKDYDSNGNLITGTNAGYDAGVTQGEANMKDGVTLDYDGNHLIQGYKARTSAGVLITGTNKGYDAGVTQGEANMKDGVTITSAAHVLSGYKGRTNSGTLVTGTAVNPSGAKSITANGNGQDVKSYATVNVSVPNSNSGTYTFPANDTGGTKDLGATNSYRYVNAENVYNKGKADGGSGKKSISVANITTKDISSSADVTFSATNGAIYAVAFGGRDSVPDSAPSLSGANNLSYDHGWVDGRGNKGSLLICQATSNSVTITISKREACVVVTRVTN